MQLRHLFSSKVLYITLNITHVSDLLYICAAQYLEFDGKLFCPSLYTYYGVCLIHVWHVLIWNLGSMSFDAGRLALLVARARDSPNVIVQYLRYSDRLC